MDLTLQTDEAGRLICTLEDRAAIATVTASNVPDAADDLLAALEAARETGYGECFWTESGGEYHWMFRRSGESLTVAVLWSSGVLTGWKQVFRAECDREWFEGRLNAELIRTRRARPIQS